MYYDSCYGFSKSSSCIEISYTIFYFHNNYIILPFNAFRLEPNLNAKINFITEKHLLDCIQQDHRLSQFGCVMIDEVHERTVNTDICLGMMKKVLRLRSDMKLVSFTNNL